MSSEEASILCMSDLHGKIDIVRYFVKNFSSSPLLKRIKVVVLAGDIGNPQKEDAFWIVMRELSKLGRPIYYVRGNWDVNAPSGIVSEEPLIADLESLGPVDIGPAILVGHGKRLEPFRGRKPKPIVLVTHYPPFSILDRGKKLESPSQSLHAGLPEINYLVVYYRPIVHVFGHSHSFGGIEVKHNGVIYANVARLDRVGRDGSYIGNYAIISLNSRGGVALRWRFLNGIWKRCSRCGRRVHLPSEWTLCRRCANRFDLSFKRLGRSLEKVKVKVVEMAEQNEVLLDDEFHIPTTTLKDEEAYADFVDYLLIKRLREIVEREGDKLLLLPKDKIIEYYSTRTGEVVPFSEYLFACDSDKVGERVCTLMKLYMLDKRTHVLWRLSGDASSVSITREYVLVNKRVLGDSSVVEKLLNQGFIPLAYSITSLKT